MNNDIVAIILAAGKGRRMLSDTPKVLHQIANQSLIAHVLTTITKIGIKNIICVCSQDSESIKEEVKKFHSDVIFVTQKKQLGTADAVKCALPVIKDHVDKAIVLYADTPLLETDTIFRTLECLNNGKQLVILGFDYDKPNFYGKIICNTGNEPIEIKEHADASEEVKKITMCNSGIMGFDAKILSKLVQKIDNNNNKQEYYLTDTLKIATEEMYRTHLLTISRNEVLGVNTIEDLILCEDIFQIRLRQKMIENGVIIKAPETVFFSADTQIAKGVVIEPYVIFGKSVRIMEDCVIKSFSHLEGTDIGKNCAIGPYARLRPETQLENNVRIGNFVETKNVNLHTGAKANHLAYLGDVNIGDNSNIGAGTITCNYDGVKKFQTTIGHDSFIGSNSSLVAPVAIGHNTIIGAGSVINKDVADDTLAVARPERKDKKITSDR